MKEIRSEVPEKNDANWMNIMDTEYQRLRTYNSYSEYKQICQKHLQTVGGDETKIVELFDFLNEDPENDVYLLKVNAVLDCSSSGSVQKVVTDETGRTVRMVIARATRCLKNFVGRVQ